MIASMKKKTPKFDWERGTLVNKIEKRHTYLKNGGKEHASYKQALDRRTAKKAKKAAELGEP